MTIDEAIAHAREVATEQKRRSGACVINDNECDKFSACIKCAKEHEQLAEWLEELKAYRENSNGYNKEDIELNRNAMYNKAIDDFVNQFNVIVDEKCGTDTNNYFRKIVKEIAEQLKVGDN